MSVRVQTAAATRPQDASAPAARRRYAGLWSDAWYRLTRDPVTIAAAVVLLILVLLALAADLLSQYLFRWGFTQQDLLNNYRRPTLDEPAFWLGSDVIGRSQVVRLLYGARISLAVGFGAAVINLTIGVILGLSAGYFRGWWDDFVQFLISTLNSIPALFLLLIVAVLFTPGTTTLIIILGLLTWPGITLFVRGQTLSLREREFVQAARALGATNGRIMLRHILPNVAAPILILASIYIGNAIIVEASLSFLGLGTAPPTPSWGSMLSGQGRAYMEQAPWLAIFPGLAISLGVLGFNLFGDGLRDVLDPRSRPV